MKIDSVIFDLDGVLWDSTATVAKAWQATIDKLGYSLTIDQITVRSIAGTQHDLIFPTLFPHLSEGELKELTLQCGREELSFIKTHGAELFPDVAIVLQKLSQTFPLFIVSNCQAGYIELFLTANNFNHLFKDFECSGRTQKSKSENIRSVISRNKLKAPVYVGDTLSDLASATENNIPFIYAEYGFGEIESFERKITGLKELEQFVIHENHSRVASNTTL